MSWGLQGKISNFDPLHVVSMCMYTYMSSHLPATRREHLDHDVIGSLSNRAVPETLHSVCHSVSRVNR